MGRTTGAKREPRTRSARRNRMGTAAMVLAAVGALIFDANTASAYNLEGYKWGGTPSSGCCANNYFGFHGSYLSDVGRPHHLQHPEQRHVRWPRASQPTNSDTCSAWPTPMAVY